MPGTAIGINLNLGFVGTPSRQDDNLIRNRINGGAANILFGAPVILKSDNTIDNWAADSTADVFAGVAISNVKTLQTYGYTNNTSGYYAPQQATDVLERGSVPVFCKNGTPTAGGAVYIRTVASGTHLVGDFEAVADAGNNVLIPNAKWTTGKIDSNGVAEITILTRVNP